MEPLYDAERLLVLKELNIGSLCQLTTLLQKYYEFDDGNYRSDVYLEDANSSVAANGKIHQIWSFVPTTTRRNSRKVDL